MNGFNRVGAAGLAIALLAAGCGERRTGTQARNHLAAPAETLSAGAPATPTPVAGTPAAGTPAPAVAAAVEPEVRPAAVDQILGAVRASTKNAIVVNVWATWCGPCREEFPDLVRLQREYRDRGMELMLVSADFDNRLPEVRRFLARQGVDFPSFIKSGDDMEFINRLNPQWTGAIPATFIYDRDGRLRWFHEGKATFAQFEQRLLEVIEPGAAGAPGEEKS